MNGMSAFSSPSPVLLYLGNVAAVSVIVCSAGLLVERLCGKASLAFRHVLLVAALASAVAAPVVIAVTLARGSSLVRLSVGGEDQPDSAARVTRIAAQGEGTLALGELSARDEPVGADADKHRGAELKLAGGTSSQVERPSELRVGPTWSWLGLLQMLGATLAALWIAGCIACSLRLVLGLREVRRLRRGLGPVADARLRTMAAAESKKLGLRRVPELYESPTAPSPLVIGIIRPIVVLPVGLGATFNARQLACLFRHELAHVARRDHHVGVLQRVATIVFWWNPLIHRMSERVAALRELICDDVATGADEAVGADGADACAGADGYAAMLVELAGRVANSRVLPATMGVLEGSAGEFSQRIHRLLDADRRIVAKLSGRSKALAAGFCLLLLLPAAAPVEVHAAADESPAPAGESRELSSVVADEVAEEVANESDDAWGRREATPVKWPRVLRGVIRDINGKPIAGARVRFDCEKIHEYSIGRWDEVLDSQSLVTGADGIYSFDAAKLPKLTHRPFSLTLTCTAEGYADTRWWNWYSRKDIDVGEHLTNVDMKPGRVVAGRCVDPNGLPVAGAVVKMASGYDSNANNGLSSWAWAPRETDADGKFSFSVPRTGDASFEIWAIHPEWSPKRMAVPKDRDHLGDIRLERGAPVEGTVLHTDGTPAAGVVVVAESVDSGDLPSIGFAVHVAARTDGAGHYTMQPLAGAYKIFLSQAEKNENSLEHPFAVAAAPLPVVTPARVELAGTEPKVVDFRGGRTLTVSGTIRWLDGRPVGGSEVQASYMPEDNGTGIWIARALTDEEGRYTIELPNPIADVSIHSSGEYDEDRVWCSAFPVDTVDAEQRSEQNIQLKPLDDDLDGADWVLKPS
jgi:Zn-dependent protease with chaperone function/protocatechuate 3,4-dioxygenase beta subunit